MLPACLGHCGTLATSDPTRTISIHSDRPLRCTLGTILLLCWGGGCCWLLGFAVSDIRLLRCLASCASLFGTRFGGFAHAYCTQERMLTQRIGVKCRSW